MFNLAKHERRRKDILKGGKNPQSMKITNCVV